MNAAQVSANGCALWAIFGQQAQQLGNAKAFPMAGDQSVQIIPPRPLALATDHGQHHGVLSNVAQGDSPP